MTAGAARGPSAGERAFFGEDVEVVTPRSAGELADLLREAAAAGRKIRPAGLGAHAGAADPEPGALLVSLAGFDRVVDYQPDDFTIGVEAGAPLAAIQEVLAKNGQEIPIDAAGSGTIGGLVARAHSGPRQAHHGPLATLVLGVEGTRTTGQPFRAGGMVVKNVAGYALHRFVVGSMGRAAFLTRVNFRLRPIPERRSVTLASFETRAAADACASTLRTSRLEPILFRLDQGAADRLPLESPETGHHVVWLFEGSQARVDWLSARAFELSPGGATLTDGETDEASETLEALALLGEPPDDPRAGEGIVRLSVPPTEAAATLETVWRTLEAAGAEPAIAADAVTGLVTARWKTGDAEPDEPLAAITNAATAFRGAARLLFLPPAVRSRWQHRLSGSTADHLRDRVLDVFDPQGALR